MFYFCLLILSLLMIVFVGFKCTIIQLAVYIFGFLILLVVNKNDGHIKRLYNILFLYVNADLYMRAIRNCINKSLIK